jgi:hypothetical protein
LVEWRAELDGFSAKALAGFMEAVAKCFRSYYG